MDVLTMRNAAKRSIGEAEGYADQKAIDTLNAAKEYAEELAYTGETAGIYMDRSISHNMLLNAFRQHVWQNEDDALICEEGTVNLTNSSTFPFNNSKTTVALANRQKNQKYVVIPEIVTASGSAGEVIITDKAVNGFKIAFNGGGKNATVKYYVIGGFIA